MIMTTWRFLHIIFFSLSLFLLPQNTHHTPLQELKEEERPIGDQAKGCQS
jgi:hypothetical protein